MNGDLIISDELSTAIREVMQRIQGTYEAEGVSISFDGACPVQGFGTVDGHTCYYRSRGTGWQFEIYDTADPVIGHALPDKPIWYYDEDCYEWPDGGWIEADVSKICIEKAVALWRAREQK